MAYDRNNVFAKILRGEIPSKKVHDDAFAMAFHDIHPQAPIHVLVIPKGEYESMADFSQNATDAEIAGLFRAAGSVARKLGAETGGYRILANSGHDARQEVPHFHVHIFAGRDLGPMLGKSGA